MAEKKEWKNRVKGQWKVAVALALCVGGFAYYIITGEVVNFDEILEFLK